MPDQSLPATETGESAERGMLAEPLFIEMDKSPPSWPRMVGGLGGLGGSLAFVAIGGSWRVGVWGSFRYIS